MSDWRERAGNGLLDPNDPYGIPIATPLDRRWLWRLEGFLAISGTNDTLRLMGTDLRQYLHETCEHHWTHYEQTDPTDWLESHRQCLWCCYVEWESEVQQ